MGFQLKSPTPGVFQSQFPTPMGDGSGDPMGPRVVWGWGENPRGGVRESGNKCQIYSTLIQILLIFM